MGMSSSQARLLNLTSRMHQIEYKAAKLEAQKLQMANESAHVYNEYLNALEATKIQGAKLGSNGQIEAQTLNLSIIENNRLAGSAGSYKLIEPKSGKTYVTQSLAEFYNLDPSGEITSKADFLENAGFETIVTKFDAVENAAPVTSYDGIEVNTVPNQTRVIPNYLAEVSGDVVGFQNTVFGSGTVTGRAMAEAVAAGNFVANETYLISSEADLVNLKTLVNTQGANTENVTFVLTRNLDMSSIDWDAGIGTSSNKFKGILDGNYCTISGLTGKMGLFRYMQGNMEFNADKSVKTYATTGIVRNLIMEGLNITNGLADCGGIAGITDGCYISNVCVSGNLTAHSHCGGIAGTNQRTVIEQSTSGVNVSSPNYCVGAFTGHDTSGILINCLATGNVTGTGSGSAYYVGGFIGHETNSGKGVISNCVSTSTVSVPSPKASYSTTIGSFIGKIDSGCDADVQDSIYKTSYKSGGTALPAIGSGKVMADSGLSEIADISKTTTYANLPSKESVASNIYMALKKSGKETLATPAFATKLSQWLDKIYTRDMTYSTEGETNPILCDEAVLLASVNDYIVEYLEDTHKSNPANGAPISGVVDAVVSDINAMTITMFSSTADYQNKYSLGGYATTPYANHPTPGARAEKFETVTTGSVNNIANNLYTAFRELGHTDVNQYKDFQDLFSSLYSAGTLNQKLELAEISNHVTRWLAGEAIPDSDIEDMYIAIVQNRTKYHFPAEKKVYTTSDVTYVVDMVDNPDQERYAKINFAEYDMADPAVVAALGVYAEFVPNGYIIVPDDIAQSSEWLSEGVKNDDILFQQYINDGTVLIDTSIATNVNLSEVADETLLKKAEAKYEADMRKIDQKDRMYDHELAKLDNERNAIKSEMETLKTVARENVERTFKLFG